ncbi:hypothetical protein JHK82_052676 [Glycine max]|nr:hypothetical protein JHK86_052523 [Glycine max]KAG5085279.1 hypothetical protein JHK82_052676 [Glycine max]
MLVYSGWEGTTNDSRVFLDGLSPKNNFPKPNGEVELSHLEIQSFKLSAVVFEDFSVCSCKLDLGVLRLDILWEPNGEVDSVCHCSS